jgi:hypothetical protein
MRRRPGYSRQEQGFDAAVLEELDGHALERAPVVGDLGLGPAPMADHVGQSGAVAVEAGNTAGVIEDVGQADSRRVVVGKRRQCLIDVAGVGDQLRAVLPQGTQVEIEPAFVVEQERAVPLALQHGAAVGRLQAEVGTLSFGMVVVIADAVVKPVSQSGDGQRIEQPWRLREKLR